MTTVLAITGETYEGNALGIFSLASGEAIGSVGTRGVSSRGGWGQLQFNWTRK